MGKIITEICVDTIESAIIAEESGADEIELCQALNAGGLTPSLGFLKKIKENIDLPINIMIRPRSGDFYYSEYEKDMMIEDIKIFIEEGIDRIVLGALDKEANIDVDFIKRCLEVSGNRPITFHRAFDMTNNKENALEELIDLGVSRVLTSGGKNSAYDGKDMIEKLVNLAGKRIEIMAGAGISKENIKEILEYTGVAHIHFSAKEKIESKMVFRNNNISMGGSVIIPEYDYFYTSKKNASKMINIVKDMS